MVVSPAWLAARVQVPALRIVTVLADTVQTVAVVVVNETANPDEAVAVMANGGAVASWVAGAVKLIVCAFLLMVNERVMTGAAL